MRTSQARSPGKRPETRDAMRRRRRSTSPSTLTLDQCLPARPRKKRSKNGGGSSKEPAAAPIVATPAVPEPSRSSPASSQVQSPTAPPRLPAAVPDETYVFSCTSCIGDCTLNDPDTESPSTDLSPSGSNQPPFEAGNHDEQDTTGADDSREPGEPDATVPASGAVGILTLAAGASSSRGKSSKKRMLSAEDDTEQSAVRSQTQDVLASSPSAVQSATAEGEPSAPDDTGPGVKFGSAVAESSGSSGQPTAADAAADKSGSTGAAVRSALIQSPYPASGTLVPSPAYTYLVGELRAAADYFECQSLLMTEQRPSFVFDRLRAIMHLCPRPAAVPVRHGPPVVLKDLSNDLWSTIANHVRAPRDMFNFAATCRRARNLLQVRKELYARQRIIHNVRSILEPQWGLLLEASDCTATFLLLGAGRYQAPTASGAQTMVIGRVNFPQRFPSAGRPTVVLQSLDCVSPVDRSEPVTGGEPVRLEETDFAVPGFEIAFSRRPPHPHGQPLGTFALAITHSLVTRIPKLKEYVEIKLAGLATSLFSSDRLS